jgi:hypothetical protein
MDLVGVPFTTPLRDTIFIILPVRKHIASGKSHGVNAQRRADKICRINIHSWIVECACALGS